MTLKSKKQKTFSYNMQLNSIQEIDDPTILKCTFIILDFEVSRNNAFLSKEVAMSAAPTLLNKAIVAKYHKVEEPNTSTDAFGGHEQQLETDKYNDLVINTNTTPIGTFTREGYIIEIGEGDNKKEVLACDAVLWRSRFNDAIDLLLEWYNRGIPIMTSCEYLYMNFTVQDGIETINEPVIFDGHAILNSEVRGEHEIVNPAYESSKLLSFNELNRFERLVASAVESEALNINKQNNAIKEETESMEMFKKYFELSHNDIRSRIYTVLDATLVEGQYSSINDVYDSFFIVNIWGNGTDEYFKYDYSISETEEVTVDFESKVVVVRETKWKEIPEVQAIQTQLNEATEKITTLEKQLNEVTEVKTVLETEKAEFETQLNSANETITELTSYKTTVETEKFEKQMSEKLEEQKDFYSKKFSALSADSKFESEEVQELIKNSIGDSKECIKAKMQLNEMIIDLVELKEDQKANETKPIREFASVTEKLIPKATDFESRYGA